MAVPQTPDPASLVAYWVEEVGPKGWYLGSDALDAAIRNRYLALWERARGGGLTRWRSDAEGLLAYIILTDQFPRNMFRNDARAFATDRLARQAAGLAIHRRWDMRVAEPQRQFFYLPLMHSECSTDQDHCVRLLLTRMPETGADNLLHARAHREIIRRFGRFPYRNEALDRTTTEAEAAFLAAGGYGAMMEEMRASA